MKSFSDINSNEKNDLYLKIKSLGKWLYLDEGLGLKDVIREIFDEQGWSSKLNSSEISRFMLGLDILRKTSMTDEFINSVVRRRIPNGISNLTLVKENGNWHPVNKLNTNHSDLADMLSEMIMRSRILSPEKGDNFYRSCLENPKSSLFSIKSSLKPLLKKYFDFDDFKKFTKNSKRQSIIGNESEKKISSILENSGFKIEYSGGDGDFIDMLFGVDFIVWRKDTGHKTIQIKTNMPEWSAISYYKVDWIGVGSSGMIYDKNSKKELDLSLNESLNQDDIFEKIESKSIEILSREIENIQNIQDVLISFDSDGYFSSNKMSVRLMKTDSDNPIDFNFSIDNEGEIKIDWTSPLISDLTYLGVKEFLKIIAKRLGLDGMFYENPRITIMIKLENWKIDIVIKMCDQISAYFNKPHHFKVKYGSDFYDLSFIKEFVESVGASWIESSKNFSDHVTLDFNI